MFEGHLLNPVHYTDHIYVYWCEGVEGLAGEQVEWVCVKGLFPAAALSELSPETSTASASWNLEWVMR